MEMDRLEEKLTPAAKQALDELLYDQRRRVLLGAAESASRLTRDIREISVQDIVSGWTDEERQPFRRRRLFELITRAYTVGGILVAVASTAFLLARTNLVDNHSRFALLAAVAGGLLALVAYLAQQTRSSRAVLHFHRTSDVPERPDALRAFLNIWQQLELAIRSKVAETSGESTANRPLSVLIRQLLAEGVLTISDANKLKRILELRNGLVHAGPPVSRETLAEASNEAPRLLEKLAQVDPSAGKTNV